MYKSIARNTPKTILSYCAQWDNDFNDGYRAGYANRPKEYKVNRAYTSGYEIGQARAKNDVKQ